MVLDSLRYWVEQVHVDGFGRRLGRGILGAGRFFPRSVR
jgi:hypothetical protein